MLLLILQAFLGGGAFFVLRYALGRWLDTSLKCVPRVAGGHWLWGHEKDVWELPDAAFFTVNQEKYGKIFAMKGALFHPDILCVTDTVALNHIFTKHPYEYVKSPFVRPLVERLLGRSVVWAEGAEHKKQRPALAPVFNTEAVRRAMPEITDSSIKLVEVLREHVERTTGNVDSGLGKSVVKINALRWTPKATLGVIGQVVFAYDFQMGTTPDAIAMRDGFIAAVESTATFSAFVAPLVLRALPWLTSLPVESMQKQGEVRTLIRTLGKKLIRERQLLEQGGEKRGKDLLSLLLNMYDGNLKDDENQWDEILDQITTFMLAGHETTSSAIAFGLYLLSRDKAAQDCLRQELVTFEESSCRPEPTFDEYMNSLPYLDAVCKESMRVYPSVGLTQRVAAKDDLLPLGTPLKDPKTGEDVYTVPIRKGQVFSVSHIAVNRSKAVWGPDADEFKPERWLPGKDASQSRVPAASNLTKGWSGLVNFIEGPRLCLGFRFAVFEFKVILAHLVKNFEFLPVEGPDGIVETTWVGTLRAFVRDRKWAGTEIPVHVKCFDH